MQRPLVQLVDRAFLDELAQVHHPDAIAEVPHHRQVVRDEEVGETEVALQVVEQVQHSRLHADVERTDRLIEHDDLGFDRERPGDAQPLPLPTRELMREAVGVRGVEAHLRQQLLDAAVMVPAVQAVDHERLGERRPHRLARIQRGVRVLEHELHATTQGTKTRTLEPGDVVVAEPDRAAVARLQPGDAASERGLAASRLADEAERLPALDRQAHVRDRLHDVARAAEQPAADAVLLDEVLHGQAGAGDRAAHDGAVHDAASFCHSSIRTHAAVCPSPTATGSGTATSQRPTTACAHRGANRHPTGQAVATGG